MYKFIIILVALVIVQTVVQADLTVSTNTVSGDWSDASRWSAGVPSATVDAVLAASVNAVSTKIENIGAEARSLILSNANMSP